MNLTQALEQFRSFEETSYALRHAMSVLYVDGDTAAPKQSYEGRGRALGYLSGLMYEAVSSPSFREAVETVLQQKDSASPEDLRKAELYREDLLDSILFTKEECMANTQLVNEANMVWHDAKEKSDYSLFAPFLEKLIAYQKTFAERKDSSRPAYDVLLDSFEKGTSTKTLDPFFELLRRELTPVIHAVSEKPQPRTDFLHRVYPIHLQRDFSDRLMAMMGIDRACCNISETEHPFTDGVNKWDVRITTKYIETDPASSMYSVIHEGGHALYELGVKDEYQFTRLAGGGSMGIHESQSRFYENLIGRSLPFSRAVFPVVKELFPEQVKDVTAEEWYRGINMAQPSLIRTEADELTYPLHVLIRYEIEKKMFGGDVKVQDLPALWNELYRTYLGVTPSCDREGILQDSHWSGASFGYFPSYALGSAYGVQMLHNMEKDVDVWGAAEKGDLRPITAWLREHVHQYGQFFTSPQVLISSGVDPFDPNVYVQYLKDKYTELYNL